MEPGPSSLFRVYDIKITISKMSQNPGQDYDSPSEKGYSFQSGAKAVIEVDLGDGTRLKRTATI